TNPGFVVRITQAGLDYAHQQAINFLEQELGQLKLQDISGDFRVLRVGKVHYEISRLYLRSFHLPHSSISLVPRVGLQVSISNAFAELDGHWRVKIYFIRDHGSFELKVENIYIKISLQLGRDALGKPTVDTSACSTHISKVLVHFSGKLGWLYNLFHAAVESRFRKLLEKQVCESVAKSVREELQPYLRTLPVTARLDAMTGIDYSLVAPPAATAQSLDVDLKGEFFSLAHRSAVPFSPLPVALPPDHSHMVYFGASSYFFNTAAFAYHAAGALVFDITDAVVSGIPRPDRGFVLLSPPVPAPLQLEEMYPNAAMKFRLSAPSAPFLSIGPQGLSFQPVVDAQAYAILPGSSPAPLFLLSLVSNVSAVIDVRSGHLVGSLKVGSKGRKGRGEEGVGCFAQLLFLLLQLSSHILSFPERLDQGFPLPLPDRIQLSKILLRFHQNFLLLGADVLYQPR
ncbi:BPI protein, partial [Ramphastos sulfuratus]|nr:BPI protein [Ramphastos sulfuratus]